MADLTPRQQEVLDHIADEIRKRGRPPTLRELASHFGWKSDNSARQHLRLLEQKGVLILDAGHSRGIRLSQGTPLRQQRDVPLVGQVAAGLPLEAIENIEGHILVDPAMFPESDVFALRVQGDSMIDVGIRNEDVAIIRKQAEAQDNDIVIALLNGEATLKRYLTHKKTIILRAENAHYKDITVTARDEFAIVGVAIGIMRRL